jgi:SAM-dependent methyltransferase
VNRPDRLSSQNGSKTSKSEGAAPGEARSLLAPAPAEKVRAIPVARIVEAYRDEHNFDVSRFLPPIDSIDVYRCRDTDLRFYFPLNLAGPPEFYESLYSAEGVAWAYREEKWEFDEALPFLSTATSVLDIGCGGGAFLRRLAKKGVRVTGLEPSRHGRDHARANGIEVFDQTIGEHAATNAGRYEAVTAFQVLEHIGDPASFLKAAIAALKPGGALVISVPNNDAFLKHCEFWSLNMPPHHVTLWSRQALQSLARLLPIDLVTIKKEPLQEENVGWYLATMEKRLVPNWKIARVVYYRFGAHSLIKRLVAARRRSIDGHTIMAVYRKRMSDA